MEIYGELVSIIRRDDLLCCLNVVWARDFFLPFRFSVYFLEEKLLMSITRTVQCMPTTGSSSTTPPGSKKYQVHTTLHTTTFYYYYYEYEYYHQVQSTNTFKLHERMINQSCGKNEKEKERKNTVGIL